MAGRSAPNSKRLTEPALPCFCSSCADPSLLPVRGGKWKGKIVNITVQRRLFPAAEGAFTEKLFTVEETFFA